MIVKIGRIFALVSLAVFLVPIFAVSSSASASTATLVSFTLTPTSMPNGGTYSGTVTLSGPAPAGGSVVGLVENVTVLKLPGVCTPICTLSVTVPAGATSATFTNTTNEFVLSDSGVLVTATLGSSSVSASMTVTPGVDVTKLSFKPSSVVGGNDLTGTVTISAAAPSSGDEVLISKSATADPPFLVLPIIVTVPAGKTSATFSVGTTAVTKSSVAIIFAQSGTTTVSVDVTVKK